MKQATFWIMIVAMSLTWSCDNTTDPNTLVDPADANALTEVLIMPSGADLDNGTPPAPSASPTAPTVNNNNPIIQSSNGSTAPLNFEYGNVSGNLGGCYVQIEGADRFYTVPYNSNAGTAGNLQLPIGLPTNLDEGEFCVNFCVYDNTGAVSNVVSSCVSVLRLGTGAIQVSLSWNNDTDQDLYVIDPSGEEISFLNTTSESGGELDRDDTSGYGPENIYWRENAPDGTYQVKVNDYSGFSSPTTFYVTVSGPNTSRSFTGTTLNGSTADVVTFRKDGNTISF